MGNYQKFLKSELAALAEKHPEMSAMDRLNMARRMCQAQNAWKATALIQRCGNNKSCEKSFAFNRHSTESCKNILPF